MNMMDEITSVATYKKGFAMGRDMKKIQKIFLVPIRGSMRLPSTTNGYPRIYEIAVKKLLDDGLNKREMKLQFLYRINYLI